MQVDLSQAKSSHLAFYCILVVQNVVMATAKSHEEAEEQDSTKHWGRVLLLQHQRENLFQLSKAHQTLTHISKIKASFLSSLDSRDTTDPTNFSFPSFPEATLYVKS